MDYAKAETLINQALVDKNIPVCEIHVEYGQVINKPCYFKDAIRIDEHSLLKLNDEKLINKGILMLKWKQKL